MPQEAPSTFAAVVAAPAQVAAGPVVAAPVQPAQPGGAGRGAAGRGRGVARGAGAPAGRGAFHNGPGGGRGQGGRAGNANPGRGRGGRGGGAAGRGAGRVGPVAQGEWQQVAGRKRQRVQLALSNKPAPGGGFLPKAQIELAMSLNGCWVCLASDHNYNTCPRWNEDGGAGGAGGANA
jgi:hypothetical protein